MSLCIDFSVIAALILGFWQFREPPKARFGNMTAAFALLLAIMLVLVRHNVIDLRVVLIAVLIGAIPGLVLARTVNMIQIPAMIAFQHGAGGVAAFLVSFVELTRPAAVSLTLVNEVSGVLGLVVGSLTFSGSMIASAKLAGRMQQAPQVLYRHTLLVLACTVALLGIGVLTLFIPADLAFFLYSLEVVLGACLGLLLAIRIGGADMPVLISSLNATAGFAAALCGMVIENQLLIAFGATVAASGPILTYVMCKAMNRQIFRIIFPRYEKDRGTPMATANSPESVTGGVGAGASSAALPIDRALAAISSAKSVVIVPGYGMALAQAQMEVAHLAKQMISMGKEVKYAIHPVAGRMPGHMNVLLAEAGIDYEMLVDMENINPEFQTTDLALVVGACDVVNPAAIEIEGTPISGMPILQVHEARNVVCCNFDKNPGYSGVANTLYDLDKTIFLEGDAKASVSLLRESLTPRTDVQDKRIDDSRTSDVIENAVSALSSARRVVIIPGYGMALAKAQFKLTELAALLERRGAEVKYAIHPVAGRMPGHMNVLLAEADVRYEDLLEMDEANPLFAETDVALVVGACDVVNPAAVESEGTPISGMPILLAGNARQIIVCNFDRQPGYSGVANLLYDNPRTIMVPGDAQSTLGKLLDGMHNETIR